MKYVVETTLVSSFHWHSPDGKSINALIIALVVFKTHKIPLLTHNGSS